MNDHTTLDHRVASPPRGAGDTTTSLDQFYGASNRQIVVLPLVSNKPCYQSGRLTLLRTLETAQNITPDQIQKAKKCLSPST